MPGHKDKGAMSEREDTLKPAMEMGPMQGTQMQTNAFNPMPTTSQAEIFRMNPGLQQELGNAYESRHRRKKSRSCIFRNR